MTPPVLLAQAEIRSHDNVRMIQALADAVLRVDLVLVRLFRLRASSFPKFLHGEDGSSWSRT